MAKYSIFFKKSVRKDLRSIPSKDLEDVLRCVKSLGENPRQTGSKKLTGQEKYRYRVGAYRIIYSIQDEELTVWVVKVGHRKNVYR